MVCALIHCSIMTTFLFQFILWFIVQYWGPISGLEFCMENAKNIWRVEKSCFRFCNDVSSLTLLQRILHTEKFSLRWLYPGWIHRKPFIPFLGWGQILPVYGNIEPEWVFFLVDIIAGFLVNLLWNCTGTVCS